MKAVLNMKDLLAMEKLLREGGFTDVPLEITMPIHTRKRLNKLNDEFYKEYYGENGQEGEWEEKATDIDELKIGMGNITFIYKLVETEIRDNSKNSDKVVEDENK